MICNQQKEKKMDSKPSASQEELSSNVSRQHGPGKDHLGIYPTVKDEAHRFLLDPFRRDENDCLAENALAPSSEALISTDTKTPPPPTPSVFRRDLTRGPLKKRPTSPVPHRARWAARSPLPPVPPLPSRSVVQLSLHAMPCAPLLRQSSSTYSAYSHHQHLPPHLYLTSSCGRQLMSEPLLATPTHVCMTPQSACDVISQVGQPVGKSSLTIKHQHEGKATLGLDLLAEQVVMSGNRVTEPIPGTLAGLKETERLLPVPVTSSRSKEMKIQPVETTSRPFAFDRPIPPEPVFSSTCYINHPTAYSQMGYHSNEYATRHHQAQHPRSYEYDHTARPSIGNNAHFVHTIPPSNCKNQAASFPLVPEVQTSGAFPCNRNNYQAAASPRRYVPPEDPVANLPALFSQAPGTRKACRCGNSQCLKLYCECFHSGALCDSKLCRCKNCKNNEQNNELRGAREYAILRIMAKRPDAFHIKVKRRNSSFCKCKKNYCLKKYCECMMHGRKCSKDCKCAECKNFE